MSCLASASNAVCAAVPARRIATARAAGSQRPVRVSAPGGAASTGRHQKAAFVPSSRRVVADAVTDPDTADAVTDPDTADAFGVKKMNPEDIPPTALQFMVEMSCGKCVAAVESAVAAVAGVEAVTAALDTNTVRVVARLQQSDDVIHAITQKGYKCRLIGSGDVEGFGEDLAVRLGTDLRTLRQSLAAVAEFKGEVYGHGDVAGVVRFVAVNESTCLVEGAVQGLVPHGKYAVTVRTYGDTTRGVASTGGVYDCENENENEDEDGVDGPTGATPAGDLGTVTADANGKATIPSRVVDSRLKVWDVIGRSLAIVGVSGDEEIQKPGAAAVLARSAGVGENLKRVCHCDGTVIFESTPDDFKPEKA
jgi:copper chaperone for superoxide dismutase